MADDKKVTPLDKWEIRHRQLIELRVIQLAAQFDQLVYRIAQIAADIEPTFKSEQTGTDAAGTPIIENIEQPIDLTEYPQLKEAINQAGDTYAAGIEVSIRAGVENAWDLSREKNLAIIDKRFPIANLPASVQQILYDPMKPALDAFLTQVRDGSTLSDAVWKIGQQLRTELSAAVQLGIEAGLGAKEMFQELKNYLNEPDKAFRRVRNSKGDLVLPESALDYHPGRGVYRSSRLNVERLTRTTINMSYRLADQQRWKAMPMVVGYRISLSSSHPKADLCNDMAGDYPKWFIFIGWHPNCFCISTPILMSDDEYKQWQKRPLGNNDTSFIKYVDKIPASAQAWLDDNGDHVDSLASTPFWVDDNFKNGMISSGLKGK